MERRGADSLWSGRGRDRHALITAGLRSGYFAAVVALDAFAARGRLAGVGVGLPEVVRLQKERPDEIELIIRNDTQRERTLRIGFAFPPEIVPQSDDLTTRLPAGTKLSRVKWPCVPRRRGQYLLEFCHLEAYSSLGFWAVRGRLPCKTELRVYPNLFDERRHVASLFLNRGTTASTRSAQWERDGSSRNCESTAGATVSRISTGKRQRSADTW